MSPRVELLGTTDDPPRYRWPFTVADQARIDALDEATRDSVERYVRSYGIAPPEPPTHLKDDQLDDLAERITDSIDIRGEIYHAIKDVLARTLEREKRLGGAA